MEGEVLTTGPQGKPIEHFVFKVETIHFPYVRGKWLNFEMDTFIYLEYPLCPSAVGESRQKDGREGGREGRTEGRRQAGRKTFPKITFLEDSKLEDFPVEDDT